ncbi:MAG: phosphatase PAP2 family protein [Bacillus sp. (in: firmicutes)]
MKQELLSKKAIQYMIMIAALLAAYSFIFFEIVDELKENELEKFDFKIIEFVQSHISDQLTAYMKAITFMGGQTGLILAVLLSSVIFFFYKKRYAVYLVLSSALGGLFNYFLKWLFQRERPDFYRLIEADGYSFPSGHSMAAFIFYTSLAVVLAKVAKNKLLDFAIAVFFTILVLLIGISRIYLGVHYPSDVIAGFAAGGFWVCLCGLTLNYYELRRRVGFKHPDVEMK